MEWTHHAHERLAHVAGLRVCAVRRDDEEQQPDLETHTHTAYKGSGPVRSAVTQYTVSLHASHVFRHKLLFNPHFALSSATPRAP